MRALKSAKIVYRLTLLKLACSGEQEIKTAGGLEN
jgi:hypothetical protein